MDTIIRLGEVESLDGKKPEGLEFDLIFEKNRHFWGEDAESMRVNMSEDGIWEHRVFKDVLEDRIRGLLDLKMTATQIAHQLKIEPSYVLHVKSEVYTKQQFDNDNGYSDEVDDVNF